MVVFPEITAGMVKHGPSRTAFPVRNPKRLSLLVVGDPVKGT